MVSICVNVAHFSNEWRMDVPGYLQNENVSSLFMVNFTWRSWECINQHPAWTLGFSEPISILAIALLWFWLVFWCFLNLRLQAKPKTVPLKKAGHNFLGALAVPLPVWATVVSTCFNCVWAWVRGRAMEEEESSSWGHIGAGIGCCYATDGLGGWQRSFFATCDSVLFSPQTGSPVNPIQHPAFPTSNRRLLIGIQSFHAMVPVSGANEMLLLPTIT